MDIFAQFLGPCNESSDLPLNPADDVHWQFLHAADDSGGEPDVAPESPLPADDMESLYWHLLHTDPPAVEPDVTVTSAWLADQMDRAAREAARLAQVRAAARPPQHITPSAVRPPRRQRAGRAPRRAARVARTARPTATADPAPAGDPDPRRRANSGARQGRAL